MSEETGVSLITAGISSRKTDINYIPQECGEIPLFS
jgi:hypothetical protein